MRHIQKRLAQFFAIGLAITAFASTAGAEEFKEDLPPYKMLRSLQAVQDSIAQGDASANDMQRFMLSVIDRRLRAADPSVFEDPRNVDAALIYAMSGGNPATLNVLIQKDAAGNFDNRVTDSLLQYFRGKGSAATKLLEETVPEYRTTDIGPYLALVAANSVMQAHPEKSLEYFDWARLILPGTIVEEAALRRSLVILEKNHAVERSRTFFRRYFQRFPLSPYSSQVVELFVNYLMQNFGPVSREDVVALVDPLPLNRQQAVYLRIARRAALEGLHDLGQFAAGRVLELEPDETSGVNRIARLYLGLSTLPAGKMNQSDELLSRLTDDMLGPQERRLRNAAEYVLDEISRPIPVESLTQAQADTLPSDTPTASGHESDVPADMPNASSHDGGGETAHSAPAPKLDPVVKEFITKGRDKLAAIDALLGKDAE